MYFIFRINDKLIVPIFIYILKNPRKSSLWRYHNPTTVCTFVPFLFERRSSVPAPIDRLEHDWPTAVSIENIIQFLPSANALKYCNALLFLVTTISCFSRHMMEMSQTFVLHSPLQMMTLGSVRSLWLPMGPMLKLQMRIRDAISVSKSLWV